MAICERDRGVCDVAVGSSGSKEAMYKSTGPSSPRSSLSDGYVFAAELSAKTIGNDGSARQENQRSPRQFRRGRFGEEKVRFVTVKKTKLRGFSERRRYGLHG